MIFPLHTLYHLNFSLDRLFSQTHLFAPNQKEGPESNGGKTHLIKGRWVETCMNFQEKERNWLNHRKAIPLEKSPFTESYCVGHILSGNCFKAHGSVHGTDFLGAIAL